MGCQGVIRFEGSLRVPGVVGREGYHRVVGVSSGGSLGGRQGEGCRRVVWGTGTFGTAPSTIIF